MQVGKVIPLGLSSFSPFPPMWGHREGGAQGALLGPGSLLIWDFPVAQSAENLPAMLSHLVPVCRTSLAFSQPTSHA